MIVAHFMRNHLNSSVNSYAMTNASLSTIFTLAFASFLVAGLAVKYWLATRQMRYVAQHSDAVPAAFAQNITLEAHQKAADYTLTKSRFGLLELAFGTVVLVAWTLLG
jgi:STE24 endopeptidase